MVWQLLKTVGKAVLGLAKIVIPHIRPLINDDFPKDNPRLVEQRDDIKLAQLKLQYIQHQENIDFQKEQANLSQARAKELQEFIQRAEDARLQKSFDFQVWRLEQEKAIQLQLLELNHQLQRELVAYQRETSLKVVEEQKRLENSPIWLVASDILNSHTGDEIMPLRVFFAPPKLEFDRFANTANAAKGFPDIELTLAEGLRQFFRNYSTEDKGRHLDFLAGAWVSKSFHSEASIKALFGVLKSEPTLVLESEVDGDYLNFRIAYWGINWPKYRYDPIISRLPYRDILYEAAKTRARKWQETKTKLIAAGVSPEEVDKLYGADNAKNLVLLQLEEKFKQAGINSGELELDYTVNKKDFEELCQFLIVYHCLFAGLVADEYFLFQYNLTPLLPKLIPGLTENVPETEAIEEMINAVILYYQSLYQALEIQRSSLLPELALNLALSLANLANKDWAKGRILDSMKYWLKLRQLSQPDEFDALLRAVESVLTIADLAYVQKLNECLVAVGESLSLSVKDACYNRGMNRCQQGAYEAAIRDFDQAIEINFNWAEAFYNRGLAFSKLGEYQKAIEDYSQALTINSNWADVYNNRGNDYYKLGDYEKAIADYDEAFKINPSLTEATKNRAIARGILDKVKRKQQQEEERKRHEQDELKRKQQQEEERKRHEQDELKRKQQQEERKRKLENVSLVHTLTDHSNTVRSVAISPDGQTLVSGSDDKLIKLWQLSTGKLISTLNGHYNQVYSVAISPNGHILASGSWDDTIKLWQINAGINNGKEIRTIQGHSNDIRSVVISPDGEFIASASDDKTIKIWRLSTGQEIHTLRSHTGYVHSLVISPNGQNLVSGSGDNTIKIWNLSTVKELRTLQGHSKCVYCVAISPDGEILASGSEDNTIKIWQLSTGKELRTITGHSGQVYSLAISPDGQTLVSGSADDTIKIWQLSTGQELKTIRGHSGYVISLAISPDGQTLVSGSYDNTIKIWRVQ
ncbi:MAG TPA: tetratricopeptide repeat protein [Leptolyngbyaceae cyanobacterium]